MNPGQRFELSGKVYKIEQSLSKGKVLVSNLSFGGEELFTIDDMVSEFFLGSLRFETCGKNTKVYKDSSLVSSYKYGDFSKIDEKYKNIAIERYLIIKPLLKKARTKEDIEHRISQVFSGDHEGELKYYRGKRISVSTIYRWLSFFEKGGQDIRTLIPSHDEKGGKGKSRLSELSDRIISEKISKRFLAEQRISIQSIFDDVKDYIDEKNNNIGEGEPILDKPCYGTVRNKILLIDPYFTAKSRYGKKEADKEYKDVYTGYKHNFLRPLEIAYMDHTDTDLFVVDEEDRLPIGRLYFTYALDLVTTYPLGFHIGFTPPSYYTASECLYHSIVPKTYMQDVYKNFDQKWLSYGLPETLYVDNARHFIGKDLRDACYQLGINLQFGRPGRGEDKARIERFFRTLNTRLLHELPGTTFSNIFDRKDYNPKKNAVISLQALEEILHIFLIYVFASQPRHALGGISPKDAWVKGCEQYPPTLSNSKEELLTLLGAVEKRQIRKTGIQFYELFYNSSELARIRTQLKDKKEQVLIKYHPEDLSCIHVLEPRRQQYITVLANDQIYTKRLSLWKHKQILGFVKENMNCLDLENLREGKKRINEIVENEWIKTKGTSTRKILARYRGIEGQVYEALRNGNKDSIIDKAVERSISTTDINSLGAQDIETYVCETDDEEVANSINMGIVRDIDEFRGKIQLAKTRHSSDSHQKLPIDTEGWF